jgi:hypothetical protein
MRVKTPKMIDLIDGIKAELLNDTFFKKSILIGTDEIDIEAQNQFKEKLHQIIDNIPFTELQKYTQNKFAENYLTPSRENVLGQFIGSHHINLSTKVCKQPFVTYELSMQGHFLNFKMNGKEAGYPFFLKPIIDAILNSDENGITLKNIDNNIGEVQMIKLIKRLVLEGFFRIVQ